MFRNDLYSSLSLVALLGNYHDDSWLAAVSWSHCSEMEVIWRADSLGFKETQPVGNEMKWIQLSHIYPTLGLASPTRPAPFWRCSRMKNSFMRHCTRAGVDNGYGRYAVSKSLVGQNGYYNKGLLLIMMLNLDLNRNQLCNQISITDVNHHQQLL